MRTTQVWRQWRGAWLATLFGVALGCDATPEPGEAMERSGDVPVEEPAVTCFSSKECPAEEYCAVPAGECTREGVCTAAPTACERTRETVCSCDGVQYANPCWAAADKQNVDFAGECPPPPCTSNAECGTADYCAKATGDCLGTGSCAARPLSCSGLWNPVCGCNNKTYANGCKAAAAGIGVKKLGAC